MPDDSPSVPSPAPSADLRALVESLTRTLVDDPDSVQVSETAGDESTLLEVRVAEGDVGKIIGRQGRTIRAMRTLLGAAAIKLHRRVSLEILE